jgi:rhodanese-related sulfurtransferase
VRGAATTAAAIAALLGLLAAVTPAAANRQPPTANSEAGVVQALELARWIHDKKPQLRVIDLRTATEFEEYHLPRAERIDFDTLASTPFAASDTIVLISVSGIHASQGEALLKAKGHRQVYVLRGGVQEWIDDVMSPTVASNASPADRAAFERAAILSRYFGGVPRVTDTPRAHSDAASVRRRGC